MKRTLCFATSHKVLANGRRAVSSDQSKEGREKAYRAGDAEKDSRQHVKPPNQLTG